MKVKFCILSYTRPRLYVATVINAVECACSDLRVSNPLIEVSSAVLAQIVSRPETFVSAYSGLGAGTDGAAYVRAQLTAPFGTLLDAGCMATFAAALAFSAAPAGTTTLDPLTATLHQLLTADALAAEHFCKLNTLLTLIGSPGLSPDVQAGSSARASVHFLAWLDTAPLGVGAHTQVLITGVLDSAYLLLDPTYAYALRIPYVGSGPEATLSVAENAATMMHVPIARNNLALLLDPAGTSAVPEMLDVITSGAMGPDYLDVATTSGGSSFWDKRLAQIIENLG
jgi:hypothetical protein